MNILITFYFSFLSLFLSFSTNNQEVDFKTSIDTFRTISGAPKVQHLIAEVTFDKKDLETRSGKFSINFEISETIIENIIFQQSLTISEYQEEISIGEINSGRIIITNYSEQDRIKASFIRKVLPGKTYTIKANELNQNWVGSSTLTSEILVF